MSFHETPPLLFTRMKSDSWNRRDKLRAFIANWQQDWSDLWTNSRQIRGLEL